jgi:hypothetical protein
MSNQTLKRILMAAGAAGFMLLAFLFFTWRDRGAVAPQSMSVPQEVEAFITRSTTQPERTITSGDVRLTPGERTFAVIYDKVTGDPKYQFRAERWEPVTDTEFHLTKPELHLYSPKGEITYVQADEGQMTMAQSGRRSLEPKRGRLSGDVRVIIDRTTHEWRTEHPEEAPLENHLEYTISIFLADVRFDLDRARLESDGRLRVQSVEADVDGSGLVLAWNEVDNRIDYLTIKQGRQMELRRGGGMVEFALPGTTRAPAGPALAAAPSDETDLIRRRQAERDQARARPMTPAAVGPTASEAASEIRAAVASANLPAAIAETTQEGDEYDDVAPGRRTDLTDRTEAMMTQARQATERGARATDAKPRADDEGDVPRLRRPKIDTYSAVFTGDVVVEQRRGMKRPGRLTCETLELIFDFGKKQKQTSFQTAEKERESAEESEPATDDQTKLVLTWSGPLEMRPLYMSFEQQTGERFDAIATGRRVEVSDERGHAVCTQLVYRNETQQVWLAGSDAEPVVMTSTERRSTTDPADEGEVSGRLVGRELFFDRRQGLARVDGPGTMDRSAQNETRRVSEHSANDAGTIHWTHAAEVELDQMPERRTDPATGKTEEVVRDYIRRAWFHGDVRVVRADEEITGEDVGATFAQPRREGAAVGAIVQLDAAGHVRLRGRSDEIAAERLLVDFEETPDGDSVPITARAAGNVLATQEGRRIAAERVDVKMARVADDAQGASEPSAPSRPRVAVTELHAYERVRALDRSREFWVRAEELHSFVGDDRQLDTATVIGAPEGPFARVRYGDYQLAGRRIEMNMRDESTDVNGPGRAYFVSERDFGGGELMPNERVRITWKDYMRVRGHENTAVFEGGIRTRSRAHRLSCDRLVVRLGPAAPRAVGSASAGARGGAGTGALRALKEAIPDAWRPVRKDDGMQDLFAGPRSDPNATRKQPVHVTASGNAVALRTIRHERTDRLLTRMHLKGDEMAVDLRRQSMNIPGRGTLLIEDYELPSVRKTKRAAGLSPPGRPSASGALFGASEPPSQTLFLWANGMSYFVDQAMVTFDRQVLMRHVSGQQVVLRDDLVAAMQVDPRTLQLPTGRQAELSCENLLVQFVRTASDREESLDVRGADLRRMVANGTVHLQDGTKSIMGERLTFSRDTNLVTVEGSDATEARIFDEEEATQRFMMWRGPRLVWDRSTDRIEAPHAQVMSRGR